MKKYPCPCCSDVFISDTYLERHVEKKHPEMLHGLPVSQFLFNMRNKKNTNFGSCIVCKSNTTFNLVTKKYNRLCNNPKCKETYVKTFKARMKKKYGTEHLLNDPDKQKEMLVSRKISGKYKYGKKEITYTGDYELDFIVFLHRILHFPEEDIISPAPMTFKYKFGNVEHFYIPDFYFPSMHLLVEIKASDNKHYRLRDIDQEKAKDAIAIKSGFNFLKIYDKDYTNFLEMIEKGNYKKPKKSSAKALNEAMYRTNKRKDMGELILEDVDGISQQQQQLIIGMTKDELDYFLGGYSVEQFDNTVDQILNRIRIGKVLTESTANQKKRYIIYGAILGCLGDNAIRVNYKVVKKLPENDPWKAIIKSDGKLTLTDVNLWHDLHKMDVDGKNVPYYFIIKDTESKKEFVWYSDDAEMMPINTKEEIEEARQAGLNKNLNRKQLDFGGVK
jgi:hypothetical protein